MLNPFFVSLCESMESNPKTKRLENEEIDRISDLPDSILSKILSNLPTKYAVGVSILSTRWKNLFPFGVPPVNLDLDDSLLLNPKEIESSNSTCTSFIDFVDKLFNETLSDVHSMRELTLKCAKKYDDSKIVSWVCAALRLNVQRLDLEFSMNESMTLFHSLNGCTTLVSMWLTLDSELCIPDDFRLPNLERLTLHKLTFDDESDASINELIEGCPALEDVNFSECNFQCLEVLCIKSHRLKGLLIENSVMESSFKLVLDVPNLEGLIYNDCVAGSYSLCEFKCLLAAHIDVGPSPQQLDEIEEVSDDDDLWYCDEVAAIVCACSSTTHLYLAACSISALRYSFVPLPVFQNLSWLVLGCLGRHWELLALLLLNAPCLEKLTFEEGVGKNEEGFAIFQKSLSGPPICLELRMKRIEFWVFKEEEDEIKLIEYFLKNGKVLEKLLLHCLPLDDASIISRLLLFPKQSKSCHIGFGVK